MSTQTFISKDSLAKSVETTSNSLWNFYRKNNLASITPSREVTWPSLCSIHATVCTVIDSVLLLLLNSNAKRNPMQQTIKHCLFAIPKTNNFGAVGIQSLGTNYTVAHVELTRPFVLLNRVPKFGKV